MSFILRESMNVAYIVIYMTNQSEVTETMVR